MFAVLLRLFGVVSKLPEHHQRGFLSLAHLRATILPLLISAPLARFVAFRLRSSPETHRIDTSVGFLAGYVDRREGRTARRMPGHAPRSYALFNCVDDLVRRACVNVPLTSCGMVDVRHREVTSSRCLGAVPS